MSPRLSSMLAVVCIGSAALHPAARGADASACLQFAVKPDGSAALSNVCIDRINFSYCIDSPGSSRPCSGDVTDVVTLGPAESEVLPAYQAEGGGTPHLAVCPYEEAPVKWKPLSGQPVVCKKTCVMC